MARFRYTGEPAGLITGVTWGPCTEIRCKEKGGSVHVMTPIPPATEFVVGEDIGYEITDERCLRHMRAWTEKFEEII